MKSNRSTWLMLSIVPVLLCACVALNFVYPALIWRVVATAILTVLGLLIAAGLWRKQINTWMDRWFPDSKARGNPHE